MKNYLLKELRCHVNIETGIEIRFMDSSDGFTSFSTHWHDYMELIMIKDGSLIVTINSAQKEVSKGELLIIPPKQNHAGTPGPNGAKIYSIFLDLDALTNKTNRCVYIIDNLLNEKYDLINSTDDPEIIRIINELIDYNKKRNSLCLQGKALEFIGKFLDLSNINSYISSSNAIQDIIDFIQLHFSEEVTVNQLSEKFNYSKSHLCRIFKYNTGTTISNYIKILRVEHGKKLLQETNDGINQISLACGFSDFSYFCRCFKELTGFSPLSFRKYIRSYKSIENDN